MRIPNTKHKPSLILLAFASKRGLGLLIPKRANDDGITHQTNLFHL